jgi:hypothetical protein
MTPSKTAAKGKGGRAARHKKKPADDVPAVKPKPKKKVKKATPTVAEITAATAVTKELEAEKVEKTVLEYVDCTSCN